MSDSQENVKGDIPGYDTGYVFSSPHIPESTVVLKDGRSLAANHQPGVVISENPDSPLHHATLYGLGIRHSQQR